MMLLPLLLLLLLLLLMMLMLRSKCSSASFSVVPFGSASLLPAHVSLLAPRCAAAATLPASTAALLLPLVVLLVLLLLTMPMLKVKPTSASFSVVPIDPRASLPSLVFMCAPCCAAAAFLPSAMATLLLLMLLLLPASVVVVISEAACDAVDDLVTAACPIARLAGSPWRCCHAC